MPKVKLKKLPKKPRANASAEVLNRYLERCKAIQKENSDRLRNEQKRKDLAEKIKTMDRSPIGKTKRKY